MPVWKLENGIRIGKILKQTGYLGFVRAFFTFSGLEEILVRGSFLFIEWMEKPVPYCIDEIFWEDDTTARVKFGFVDDEEEAAKLTGRQVIFEEAKIPSSILDQADEGNLVGFQVIDSQKKVIGIVTGINERGPQSLLEVTHEGKEFMIPVHEDLIKKINYRKKIIEVDLPEGLIDLQ